MRIPAGHAARGILLSLSCVLSLQCFSVTWRLSLCFLHSNVDSSTSLCTNLNFHLGRHSATFALVLLYLCFPVRAMESCNRGTKRSRDGWSQRVCAQCVSCPRTGSFSSADMRKWHDAQSEVSGADPFPATPVVDSAVVEVIYFQTRAAAFFASLCFAGNTMVRTNESC